MREACDPLPTLPFPAAASQYTRRVLSLSLLILTIASAAFSFEIEAGLKPPLRVGYYAWAEPVMVSSRAQRMIGHLESTLGSPVTLEVPSDDISLRIDGGANLLVDPLQITQVGEASYRLEGLEVLTGTAGRYDLLVDAAGVTDLDGNAGQGDWWSDWTLEQQAPTVSSIDGLMDDLRCVLVLGRGTRDPELDLSRVFQEFGIGRIAVPPMKHELRVREVRVDRNGQLGPQHRIGRAQP